MMVGTEDRSWTFALVHPKGVGSANLLSQFPLGVFLSLVYGWIMASHAAPAAVGMEHGASKNCVWSQTLFSVMFVGAQWDFVVLVTLLEFVMRGPTGWALLGEVYLTAPLFPMVSTSKSTSENLTEIFDIALPLWSLNLATLLFLSKSKQ
jgi:hypothetical protein